MTQAPWPSIRANNANTACACLPGPGSGELAWSFESKAGFYGPAIVGANGDLYLTSSAGLLCVSAEGKQRWLVETTEWHAPSIPALQADGTLVSTVCNEGLLFVSPDGEARRVTVGNGFCASSSPTVDAQDRIHVYSSYASDNHQVLSGAFLFDSQGNLLARKTGSSSHHPAIMADGTVLIKSESRYSRSDCTECNDLFEIYDSEGRLLNYANSRGYAADGDAWGSDQWGGNCLAMYTAAGIPVVGVGKELIVGEQRFPVHGHGNLAMSPSGVICTGASSGILAIDLDGRELWTSPVSGAHPVMDSQGTTYVLGSDAAVHAFAPSGEERWRWQIPLPSPDCHFSPSLFRGLSIGFEGMLYVSCNGILFALK